MTHLIIPANDHGQHHEHPDDAEENICRDIDTIITELKITDPLQDEWAAAVREHAAASKNDSRQDHLLYMTGYTLLARARLLGGREQIERDRELISRHLPAITG
jgi:hypothetical protein